MLTSMHLSYSTGGETQRRRRRRRRRRRSVVGTCEITVSYKEKERAKEAWSLAERVSALG
jgi:hypothetical protein